MNPKQRKLNPPSVVVVVAIVTALSLAGDSMLYIALPIYWKDAGLQSIWQVGILLSVNRFIRLPLNPFIGWFYHKVSLRTGFTLAVILGVIATCGYGIAQGLVAWIILRCLWGLSWSLFRIGGLSAVVYYSGNHNRGKTMGTYNGLYRLGSLFGMLIGGLFVPIIGLKVVSLFFGALSLIGLPLIFKSVSMQNFGQKVNVVEKLGKRQITLGIFSKKTLLVIFSGFLIAMLFQGVFMSTFSSAIEHYYGQQINLFGTLITVTALSGLIQAARWTWEPFLAGRFGQWSDGSKGRVPFYISSLLFAALTFGLMANAAPVILWLSITLLVMLSATSLTTLTDALASDAAKSSSIVSFLTVYSVAQDLGAALGPFIAYLFISLNHGFQYIYLGGSGIFLVVAVLWFIVWVHFQKINRHSNVGSKKLTLH